MRNLLLSLQGAGLVYLGDALLGEGEVILGWGEPLIDGFAPWPVGGDLLCRDHDGRREWLGVSYFIPEELQSAVRKLAMRFAPEVVVYDEGSSLTEGEHALHVRWSRHEPSTIVTAQISEDCWLYSKAPDVVDELPVPIAFGITDVDDVLQGYELTLPSDIPTSTLQARLA